MTVLAGVHEQYQGSDATTPQETLRRYPAAAVTREFISGVLTPQNIVPKLKNVCQKVWDAGLIPAVSFKLSPADVFSGAWRPYVESAAAWLRDAGYDSKTIIVLWHEPEAAVPKHFGNAEQFVMYFNQVHDWIKGIAPNLLTCHAALAYRYADKNMGSAAKPKMVPIDIDDNTASVWAETKADIKAIDAYSGRSFPLATTLPELSGFKRWLTYVVGTGTYGVTERGWMADTDAEYATRADTIRREADWLRNTPDGRRCVLYIAWLTEGTEDDPSLKPDSKMATEVANLLVTVNEPDPKPTTPAPCMTPASDNKELVLPQHSIVCPLCHGAGSVADNQTYTVVTTKAA